MGIKNSKNNKNHSFTKPIDNSYEDLSVTEDNGRTVGIVGAGLAGCLLALLLSKLGFKVIIFEKRSDPRVDEEAVDSSEFGASKSASKRSINLALSHRGMLGLRELGLLDEIMQHAIRMPCRVIHTINKSEMKQPYGKEDEAIWSVGRQALNTLLLNRMSESSSKIKIFFGYSLVTADKSGSCVFNHTESGQSVTYDFDLVVGADGAYSSVRDNMLRQGRVSFNRQFIDHGYKELSIPPIETIDSNGLKHVSYALTSYQGLHIWPRGRFMLIALPNPDKSFTATLFAPYKGEDGFDSIDNNNENSVMNYFIKYFPDVYKLMPNLYSDYNNNPVGSLVTIRTNPWNFGKIVLIGDAAHAVVPFYGQGMNSAFEDGYILYNIIKSKLQDRTNNVDSINLINCIEEFNNHRMPSTNCLADLCLEHYHDMASNTSSTFYLVKKKVELVINNIFPNLFTPIYSMVTFSNTPYNKAVEIANYQDKIVNIVMLSTVVCISSLGIALTASYIKR